MCVHSAAKVVVRCMLLRIVDELPRGRRKKSKFMEIDERFQKELEEARKLVEQYRIITPTGEADEP